MRIHHEATNVKAREWAADNESANEMTYRDILWSGKSFKSPRALPAKRVPSRRAKCGQPNQVLAMLKRLVK